MSEHARCPECGRATEAEAVGEGFAVCAGCGHVVRAAPAAALRTRRFRLSRPRLGLGLASAVLDDGGQELGRVQRARPGPRRFLALLAGAVLLAAGLLGLHALGEHTLGAALVFAGAPLLAVLALRLTARLSPPPSLLVIQSGRDPRLLFAVRPRTERGARCELDVEDENGATVGRLEVDRGRLKASVFGALAGHVAIHEPGGARLVARRVSRVRPGAVFEDAEGEVVATVGLSGGLGFDELRISDASDVDPRLVLAASLVAAP